MKNFSQTLALLFFAFVAASAAQTPFEGKVVYHVKSEQIETDMTFYCKQPKAMMETNAQGNTFQMIMDGSAKMTYMVMPKQQMYMQRPLPEAIQDAKTAAQGKAQTPTATAKRTGKTKKILGYQCEQWTDTNKDNDTEMWLTKELGSFSGFAALGGMGGGMMGGGMGGGRGRGGMPPGLSALAAGEWFPMEVSVTTKTASGAMKTTLETTSVEKKTLDAALFQPPSGFTKIEMPAGMPGMNTEK